MIQKILRKIRVRVYRNGHRPKPGSVLYSPSLDTMYGFKDHGFLPPRRVRFDDEA